MTVPGLYGAKAVDPIQAFHPLAYWRRNRWQSWSIRRSVSISLSDLIARTDALQADLLDNRRCLAAKPGRANALAARRCRAAARSYSASGAFKDLLSGEVPITFNYLQGKESYLENHQLKALAVTGRARVPAFPSIPTVAEQGYPGFEFNSWFGVLAPAGTPPAAVRRLNRELARILQLPETRERFAALGIEPTSSTPERFATQIKEELARWTPIVKAANIKED